MNIMFSKKECHTDGIFWFLKIYLLQYFLDCFSIYTILEPFTFLQSNMIMYNQSFFFMKLWKMKRMKLICFQKASGSWRFYDLGGLRVFLLCFYWIQNCA